MKWTVVSLVGLMLVLGCNRFRPNRSAQPDSATTIQANAGSPKDTTSSSADAGPYAAGNKVYEANRCARCHAIAGQAADAGGQGRRGKGPDLSKVGAKRDRDWIVEHVRNPKTHSPNSRMPPFGEKINDADLQSLADYLASLK